MVAYKLRGSKGFTLIEIIVVLVILAILIVVIVPSVMSYINEGNDARYEAVARTALINTQTAIAKDYGENGSLKGKNCVDAAIWIENCKAGNVSDARREGVQARFGSARSYGTHVKLWVTNITLNSSGDDLASAQYCTKPLRGSTIKIRFLLNFNFRCTECVYDLILSISQRVDNLGKTSFLINYISMNIR